MSVLKVFSIIQNTKLMIEKNRDVKLSNIVPKIWFNRSRDFTKRLCQTIYNDIENSFYTYNDFKVTLLYIYIFNRRMNYNELTEKNINRIKKIFSPKQLKKDQDFLLELNKRLKLDISDYFKINERGKNTAYEDLIMKQRVSPYFYLLYGNLDDEENESNVLKRFKKILKEINKHLLKKEAENGKKV